MRNLTKLPINCALYIALSLGLTVSIVPIEANAICTAYCKIGKSRPCGGTCISIHKNCTKPTTTACSGERPESAKLNYANPKHVEPTIKESINSDELTKDVQ